MGVLDATAYKAAGYTATDKAAASNAYKLLQRADIKARVAELMNERDEQRAEASEKAMEKLATPSRRQRPPQWLNTAQLSARLSLSARSLGCLWSAGRV
jgi:hypothetical protein